MTADIINLRKARKAKTRADTEKQAAENRAKFGRSKRERETASAVLKIDKSRLDGARRPNPDDDDSDPGAVS